MKNLRRKRLLPIFIIIALVFTLFGAIRPVATTAATGAVDTLYINASYSTTAAADSTAGVAMINSAYRDSNNQLIDDTVLFDIAATRAADIVFRTSSTRPNGDSYTSLYSTTNQPASFTELFVKGKNMTYDQAVSYWYNNSSTTLLNSTYKYAGMCCVTFNGENYWVIELASSQPVAGTGVVGAQATSPISVDVLHTGYSLTTNPTSISVIKGRTSSELANLKVYANVTGGNKCELAATLGTSAGSGTTTPTAGNTYYLSSNSNNVVLTGSNMTVTGSGTVTLSMNSMTCGIGISSVEPWIKDCTITLPQTDYLYTGRPIKPSPITVTLAGITLVEGTDYVVDYTNCTDVGKATITIEGRNDFALANADNITNKKAYIEKTANFNIVRRNISDTNINLEYTTVNYEEGKKYEPKVYIHWPTELGKYLVEKTDYEVSYEDNDKVGTAKVIIKGLVSYQGTVTKTFTITGTDISKATVSAIPDQLYTGSEIKPSVTVKLEDKTLTEGTDYTLTYSNNKNVGNNATVTVTGAGNYSGKTTATFRITKAKLSEATITPLGDQAYKGGIAVEPDPVITLNGSKLVKGTDYTLSYSNNYQMTSVSGSPATVKITGKNNVEGEATLNFNIVCTHNWYLSSSTPATVFSSGENVYTCSLCGETKTETIPKLDPNLTCHYKTIIKKGSYSNLTFSDIAEGDEVVSVKSSNSSVINPNERENGTYRLYGNKIGKANIVVKLASGYTHKHLIYVTKDGKLATTSVKLNKTKKTIKVGKSFKLKATVKPAETTDSLKFTSSNTKIAKVGKTSGKVTGKKAGTCKIKAKSGKKTATCVVTVK